MFNKEEKQALIKKFALDTTDTGSTQVQVALLTERIKQLTDHCQQHKKDFSTKRGLLKMVCRRRSFLRYLERTNKQEYTSLLERLQLKK